MLLCSGVPAVLVAYFLVILNLPAGLMIRLLVFFIYEFRNFKGGDTVAAQTAREIHRNKLFKFIDGHTNKLILFVPNLLLFVPLFMMLKLPAPTNVGAWNLFGLLLCLIFWLTCG